MNPDRRKKKTQAAAEEAPNKKYDKKARSVRNSKPDIDPDTWLKNTYTNDNHEMVCQICKQEMPFKKRDGEYYFETIQISDNIEIEHHELYIALCPLCAAKFKEFIKRDPDETSKFLASIKESSNPAISVNLGLTESTVRFVLTHFIDLKNILNSLDPIHEY